MKVFNIPIRIVKSNKYCDLGTEHLLCDPQKFFDPCIGHKEIPVSKESKKMIVDFHNRIRNEVALGKFVAKGNAHLPQASNMHEISWNDLLGLGAQKMTNRCVLEGSPLDMRKFPEGEDDYIQETFFTKEINLFPRTVDWKSIINLWEKEKMNYEVNFLFRNNSGEDGNYEDLRLANVVDGQTYLVGCASTSFQIFFYHFAMSACLYKRQRRLNESQGSVYLPGPPCSNCTFDGPCSTTYPGLCSSTHLPQLKESPPPLISNEPKVLDKNSTAPLTKETFWYLIVAFGSLLLT